MESDDPRARGRRMSPGAIDYASGLMGRGTESGGGRLELRGMTVTPDMRGSPIKLRMWPRELSWDQWTVS